MPSLHICIYIYISICIFRPGRLLRIRNTPLLIIFIAVDKLLQNKQHAQICTCNLFCHISTSIFLTELNKAITACGGAFVSSFSMKLSPSSEANRSSASQEFPPFYGTQGLITTFRTIRHLSLS